MRFTISTFINFSQPADNNKAHIADKLSTLLSGPCRVLEIGSGSGQHAVHLAQTLPFIDWQPSDQGEYFDGLVSNIEQLAPKNVRAPIYLDISRVENETWPISDVIYSTNVLHIMPEALIDPLFLGATKCQCQMILIYGPFKYKGQFTTESNASFDLWLKDRNPLSGIRDIEVVTQTASKHDYELVSDQAMPANNQLLVFKKTATV